MFPTASYGAGKKTCDDESFKIQISDLEKVYRYENCKTTSLLDAINSRFNACFFLSDVRGSCSLPPSCLHTTENVFDLPKLSSPEYYKDTEQRRPVRETTREVLLEENVQLAEYFTRLLHKQILPYPVTLLPMQILQASVEVFKAAVEDNVVSHPFLDHVFYYFYYLYLDKIDARLDKEFGEKLLYSIDSCHANSRELHFVMDNCPAKVFVFFLSAKTVSQ